MSDLSTTTIARTKPEPIGGIVVATAYVPTITADDTIDVQQVFPSINKVLWASINGTANHGKVQCDLGGTAKITVGTENSDITEGELLIIATSQ